MYHAVCVELFVARHLEWFNLSAVLESSAMEVTKEVSIQDPNFNYFFF